MELQASCLPMDCTVHFDKWITALEVCPLSVSTSLKNSLLTMLDSPAATNMLAVTLVKSHWLTTVHLINCSTFLRLLAVTYRWKTLRKYICSYRQAAFLAFYGLQSAFWSFTHWLIFLISETRLFYHITILVHHNSITLVSMHIFSITAQVRPLPP